MNRRDDETRAHIICAILGAFFAPIILLLDWSTTIWSGL